MSSVVEELGPIGLGTFPFSGVFGRVDAGGAADVLDCFIENGGRYVETAPSYPTGAVDLRVLLANWPRERFVVGTKCGTAPDGRGRLITSGRRDQVLRQCEGELRRLGLDRVDVIQLHHVPPDRSAIEAMGVLANLRDSGLVRWIGVSNVSRAELTRLNEVAKVDIVQNRLSLIHDGGHAELAPYCAEHEIVLNVYQVIERGQLAGRGASVLRSADDLRHRKPEYCGAAAEVVHRWYKAHILPLAARHAIEPEHLAIGWGLAQPQVACCVVGATTAAQVRRNLACAAPLDVELLAALETAREILHSEVNRDYGVDIETFRGLATRAQAH